ncbi:hypothetical protein IAT38_003879 [Cryptococcus sp. DSM 104549]
MGVKGLWSLLNPVARPVQIESMEGKRLAIDSSIWLYQFQATMRDKDGRVLVNAHVLGFLRRINKLLFHGIKPVFVFDGGAPALKRSTIAERKRKKAGAAANHAKVAEKLFAAQMRREAVKAAQAAQEQKEARSSARAAEAAARYPDEAGEQIAEGATYLEDLEGRPGPSQPRPPPPPRAPSRSASQRPASPEIPTDPEKRRKHFRNKDPYRLPEANMPTVSTTARPDARLATEEELQQFVDDVHPEDIDIESAEFRALPTEVQYEIIGDLRSRSRQQSHRRLADMLRAAPTALDFSKAQIKHLSQRNVLTQQLLTVTDMVGKAHLTIPVRIAAERNREYVLVKKGEHEGGGWALGIREGTKEKPIEVEPGSDAEESADGLPSESDSDVGAPSPPPQPAMDPDLREHRRQEVLEALALRYAPKRPVKKSLDIAVKPFGAARTATSKPLFNSAADEDDDADIVPTANDEALALALQQEELGDDESEVDPDLARALAISRREAERRSASEGMEGYGYGGGSGLQDEVHAGDEEEDDEMEEVEVTPSGRATPVTVEEDTDEDEFEEVETPSVSMTPDVQGSFGASPAVEEDESAVTGEKSATSSAAEAVVIEDDEDEGPLFPELSTSASARRSPSVTSAPLQGQTQSRPASAAPLPTSKRPNPLPRLSSTTVNPSPLRSVTQPASSPVSSPVVAVAPGSDITEEVGEWSFGDEVLNEPEPERVMSPVPGRATAPSPVGELSPVPGRATAPSPVDEPMELEREATVDPMLGYGSDEDMAEASRVPDAYDGYDGRDGSEDGRANVEESEDEDDDEDDQGDDTRSNISWSRSPTPPSRPGAATSSAGATAKTAPRDADADDGDMAPADVAAESDDYARFVAQIKGRDLNEVRTEIDDEIRVLRGENKVAMRDSDEITQTMVAQIQTLLRHFGIPYITAPMEAEAQCAKLAELGLVDGIITDDSDVFLFGGTQCFKNIFNDAKYAECFLTSDLERELSLTRQRLISLAYLLGSDYTLGLPGIGPVMALEVLANFPGDRGLEDFKDWWMRVQRGVDTPEESGGKWRASFKKRFAKSIFLTPDFPDPLVREAYKYPTTDESEEPFHWGFPKLAALRLYLHEELSWSISKVDDELTPIVQRIAKRGKTGALNKQATLDPFFDLTAGGGSYAPRRRAAGGMGVSKRLMAVIKQFKEAEARARGEVVEGDAKEGSEAPVPAPEGKAGGKGKGKRKAGDDDDGEVGKKRKTTAARGRKRAGTVSSVADSTMSSESATGGGSTSATGSTRGRGASRGAARGRGRGRGRGKGKGKAVVDE